jgi:hypothetical protein
VCDFCGCPAIDPFAVLTDDHQTLLAMAEAYEASGDPRDLDALRVIWDDHRAQERGATSHLAAALALEDVLTIGRGIDAPLDALLALAGPNGRELRFAVTDHVDGYEFEMFPALVLRPMRRSSRALALAAAERGRPEMRRSGGRTDRATARDDEDSHAGRPCG